MSRTRIMPLRSKIYEYWKDKINTAIDDNTCFKCGFTVKNVTCVERCHINSVFYGGSDDVSNLHLLCKNCHIVSEGYEKQLYFDWFFSDDAYSFIYTACYGYIKNKKKYPKEFDLLFNKVKELSKQNNEDFEYVCRNICFLTQKFSKIKKIGKLKTI